MINYDRIQKQLEALCQDCPYLVANLSNFSALLWQELPHINWVGFSELRQEQLILGPFQGKPACIQIPVGRGVCGTAVRDNKMQLVADVHQFPGHIACDSASRSEIVIPLYRDGSCWGVLDIDSPEPNRFTQEDAKGLKEISAVINGMLERSRN